MFAPPVSRPRAATASTWARRRAAALGRHGDAERAQLLRFLPQGRAGILENQQASPGQDGGRANMSANSGSPGPSWNFRNIPVFSPSREKPFQEQSAPRTQPQGSPRPSIRLPRGDDPAVPKDPGRKPTPGPPQKPAPKSPAAAAATITSETVATGPGAQTRTTIGVGEDVRLTYSAGDTTWATTAGTLSAAKGGSVVLTAPDTAKKVTVTAGKATITFTVIAPNMVTMERLPDTSVSHTKDRPDSGIQTTSFLGPDTVNFYNTMHHEVNVNAVADGVYKPFDGKGHDPHPDTIGTTTEVVAGKGTRTLAKDKACSGDPATPAPFASGSIKYVIPYEYQVDGGAFHRFASVTQLSTFDRKSSALSTVKAGARGSTTVGSPTSDPEVCANPP